MAFIAARRVLPYLRLIMAGPGLDGDCAQWIRREISHRQLERVVSLPGGLKDKTAFWESVDIYVQPSRAEGAPMALMEALWHGKPAIGTNVSGIPEIIDRNVNGLLVEAGQPAQLAGAIERLISEPEARRRFSENAAQHIQARGMTRRQMSDRYAALYATILQRIHPRT
jgi:glycosyltransferase involved in cell wall biosynthesis